MSMLIPTSIPRHYKGADFASPSLSRNEPLAKAYKSVAQKVLTKSLNLKAGESLTIETWSAGLPFANEVALGAKEIGAFPLVTYEDEEGYVKGVRSTPKEALGKMGMHEYGVLSNSDAYVFIPGPPISGYYPKITREEFMGSTSYNRSWYDAAKKAGLRGARLSFGFVGNDLARLLGRNRSEIVLHQLKAAMVDYGKLRSNAERIGALFADGVEARVITQDTELGFRFKGELEIQDGVTDAKDVEEANNICYVPPGYVGMDVDPTSVDGSVRLSPSLTRYGLLEDAEMTFAKGRFVSWSSRRSAGVLKELEGVMAGDARVPAYLLLGLNPVMKFGYGQDRFPEGALTIGAGIGGILRKGTLTVAGKTVVENGKLV